MIFLGQFREMFQIILLVAVSLVFNAHHKEKSGKIISSIFMSLDNTGRESLIKNSNQGTTNGRCFRSLWA